MIGFARRSGPSANSATARGRWMRRCTTLIAGSRTAVDFRCVDGVVGGCGRLRLSGRRAECGLCGPALSRERRADDVRLSGEADSMLGPRETGGLESLQNVGQWQVMEPAASRLALQPAAVPI